MQKSQSAEYMSSSFMMCQESQDYRNQSPQFAYCSDLNVIVLLVIKNYFCLLNCESVLHSLACMIADSWILDVSKTTETVVMNGRFQMQGGKSRILPKEMKANRFFWDSHWLEIWSNHFCPSMGPNGGSVAMDSGCLAKIKSYFTSKILLCNHLRRPSNGCCKLGLPTDFPLYCRIRTFTKDRNVVFTNVSILWREQE